MGAAAHLRGDLFVHSDRLRGSFVSFVAAFAAGLAWWSLLEYLLHRWVFHRFPRTLGRRHLQHHARLHERRLALAPLPSSLGGMAIHAAVFLPLFGLPHGGALLAGLATGYVAYEWIHYATHYTVPRSTWMRALRRHHLIHHHAQPHARFGVSSPLWDRIFATLPPAPGRGADRARAPVHPHLSERATR